jgi:integrase
MARKRELTWDKTNKRWKRKYRGRQFYFRYGKSKTDRAGYDRAVEEWHSLKTEIDTKAQENKPHRQEYEMAVKLRQDVCQYCLLEGQTELDDDFGWDIKKLHDTLQRQIVTLRNWFDRVKPRELNLPDTLPVNPLDSLNMTIAEKIEWGERLDSLKDHQRWTQQAEPGETVSDNIDSFLAFQKQRATSAQISGTHFTSMQDRLKVFRAFTGHTAIATMNGQSLTGFHSHLASQVEANEMKTGYAVNLLRTTKQFIRWCWENEIIENLPRNIGSLSFASETREVPTFTTGEITAVIDNATDKTRLFVLLALNCGMYQSDITNLKQSEVDWRQGTITRKRSKTKKQKKVPTVCYHLWDETFRLLKKCRSTDSDRVLLTEHGNPLSQKGLNSVGKRVNNDAIKLAFNYACKKLLKHAKLKTAKPFSHLRKTSSTKLEEGEYGRFSQYFLSHAPASLTEARYAKPSPEQFIDACKWLGVQFGFPTERE